MNDLISRQAAIDAICKDWCNTTYKDCKTPFNQETDEYYHCDGCGDVETLLALPSAETPTVSEKHQLSEETPTNTSTNISTDASADRPRGEWLKVIDHDGILMEHYVCDKCGMLTTDCSDFCPNCGAKMDGERSEE